MQDIRAINILIADDDEEDLELIEEAILNFEPNAVLHKVNDGKAVLEYLDELQDDKLPALIILDYNMPQMKGSEVLMLLGGKPRYQDVPKIILSTSGTPLYVHECKSKGALEYFVKPNTQRELDMLAEKMLALAAII
ncbi:response regulator receiver domain-containing protein [Anseongella ginsenosidimutans]|uniref:Response regulator receiver domain-containing protein n=1 Tax=Anseongella ginsenosidimutans TaxID=496056 RepID=A0A4R3KQY3_9SPHI|nr:response regulator [Anseongella ginsenosidimutans]QEC52917.1 response regulator [Anseongella ginsenosidimutans]TCS87310.1 response regulator receiver domain-containing protein [Anseongella ginsenosidimutans]